MCSNNKNRYLDKYLYILWIALKTFHENSTHALEGLEILVQVPEETCCWVLSHLRQATLDEDDPG